MQITGYPENLSVAAGEALTFHISSVSPVYTARLVRLIHGDRNPHGPGFKVEQHPSNIDGRHAGRVQPIAIGSCATVADQSPLRSLNSFTLAFWIWPTDLGSERQTLLARGAAGLSVDIETGGFLSVLVGSAPVVRLATPLQAREWFFVSIRCDGAGRLVLSRTALTDWPGKSRAESAAGNAGGAVWPDAAAVVFAAQPRQGGYHHHFNGKLENPCLFDRALDDAELARLGQDLDPRELAGCLCAWNFGLGQDTDRIVDSSDNKCDGRLINMPTRGMTGHNWSGEEPHFLRAPQQYGAIHFHDDDLDDARWEPSFRLAVPRAQRSGIYAVHVSSEAGEDYIPFAVTPPRGSANAEVLFILPTLTYLAYGNEAIANRPDIREMMKAAGISAQAAYPAQQEDKYIVANRLLSCYDIHSDGSGVCYSSKRRPLLNMRPCYLMPLHGLMVRPGGAAHLLPTDLYIADWLEAQGIAFDVVTDDELDRQGVDLLSRYKVSVTGAHPEYYTQAMFDAVEAYCRAGGRLMYLGGNGFFLVTSLTSERHAIETRRMRTARAWTSMPGEEYHNTTGEAGGAWKYRARPAQQLVGVGTAAVGYTSGRGYKRTQASYDERFAWVFDGIGDQEIGAFPNLIYGEGAAGFEIDRADPALGTPPSATVLATARLEDDSYQQLVDELEAAGGHPGGRVNPKVRADLTYLEYPNGGGVFSVGSCLWAGSLSYNSYQNNVSATTLNVLRRFLEQSTAEPALLRRLRNEP